MKARDDRPAGSEHDADPDYRPSDAELGIGEDDAVPATGLDIPQLLARPEVAAAIDGLVAKRVQELLAAREGEPLVASGPADPATMALMASFAETLARAIEKSSLAVAAQQPGHVKPLAPEEIEGRARAYVDMQALIRVAADEQARPEYLLTEDFYAGDYLWPKGDTIVWYGPPNTDMAPQNRAAQQIFEKMMRWIGGPQAHISNLVADEVQTNGRPAAPLYDNYRSPESEFGSVGEAYRQGGVRQHRLVERVDMPRRQTGPSRVAGTLVPEGPAGASGGPLREPADSSRPEVGSVMPSERPSPAQHF